MYIHDIYFIILSMIFVNISSKSVKDNLNNVVFKSRDKSYLEQLRIDMRSPLNSNDFKRAKLLGEKLREYNDKSEQLMLNPDLFEGDIMNEHDNRNAIIGERYKWPEAVVPYVISSDYDQDERAKFALAFDEYYEKTCVKLIPRTDEENYVYIQPGSGCSSYIGMINGAQTISIQKPGCVYVGIIIHEIMHALGFFHEQSRTDRDDYVQVLLENIQDDKQFNFRKETEDRLEYLGQPYDYSSVMHYGTHGFSKNGNPTLLPLIPGVTIGQRIGLSEIDTKEINIMYQCNINSTTTPEPPVTPEPVDFICPVDDIAATSCEGPRDCLYSNPNGDCSTFIHCTVNADNRTGTPVVKDCPSAPSGGTLQWNDIKKLCDWPPSPTCSL